MRLIIDVSVEDQDGELRIEKALLDSGAEANVVSQRLVKECGWKESGASPPLQSIDHKPIFVYGLHSIKVGASDSVGQSRTQRHDFAAVDLEAYSMVLGYPWLYDVDPRISFRTHSWEYREELAKVDLLTAEEFAAVLEDVEENVPLFGAYFQPRRTKVLIATFSEGNEGAQAQRIPEEYTEFSEVFSEEKAAELPAIDGPSHAIELKEGAAPPWGPMYVLAEKEMDALREYLSKMLHRGWIRRSSSPAGAPILFVPKKDGGLRLCVDYRALNEITIKNRAPLPLISETLDRLSKAVIFTKLDLKDAYHRIRIRAGDEWKTAFRTRYGHFEYCVMPFGLCNAPATFQQYINEALAGLIDVFCVVYLDDILIFSEKAEEHASHVRQVLERLQRYKLFVNPKKCDFHTDRVEFLGFVISTTGVSMEQSRINAIKDWPVPISFREIQVFLGFANFYRRFIHRYSHHAAPLTSLLRGAKDGRKTGPFEFGPEALEAFEKLKEAFTQAPILAHFEPGLRTMVETDASRFAIGGVLSQLHGETPDARWHPVAFYSKKMTPTQQSYHTGDQEMLAIITAFDEWRHYLAYSASTVIVKTDHDNLKRFMQKKLNGRQVRWAQKLSEFDFRIEYRPGRSNPADGPSRRPDHKPLTDEVAEELLPSIRAKLKGVFMTRRAVFTHQNRQVFIAMKPVENPLENRTLQGGRRCLGRSNGWRIQTGRDAHGLVDNRGVALSQTGLNPVAGTEICRSLVPRVYAIVSIPEAVPKL